MATAAGAPRTVESESERLHGMFVPSFGLKIGGNAIPAEALADIVSVTYDDSVRTMDGFELVVNDADVTGPPGRYVGVETDDDLRGSTDAARRYRLFEPSSAEVELSMGYLSETKTMITGTIVTMEPEFPARGPVMLRVRGLNVLNALRRKPYTDAWVNKKDSEIATELGQRTDPDTGQARFPLPVRVSQQAQGAEAPHEYVLQEDQHDIEFLMQRAKARGYMISVARDSSGAYLYFGPSGGDAARAVEYELAYGRGLISFHPSLTAVGQVRSVTVRGWDRDGNQAIAETVNYQDGSFTTNRDLDRILEAVPARDDVVIGKPVRTAAEARALARDLLRERRNSFVHASGVTIGLADLRSGCRVKITGVGSRFSGVYYVTETSHTIDGAGYRTSFRARREEASQ